MKRVLIVLTITFLGIKISAQEIKEPSEYGFKHIQIDYRGDPVDILIKSKEGEEMTKKPVLLFGLGSTPRPLILLSEDEKPYQIFVFDSDSLFDDYHLAVISKPYIPVISYQKDLFHNYYADSAGIAPAKFCERDYVDYYVHRNIAVIKHLKTMDWVDDSKFVLAGHSASATEMAMTAQQSKDITHLIYSCGNPFGRMISMISELRNSEAIENPSTDRNLEWWEKVVKNKDDNTCPKGGDSDKSTYDFSQNHMAELLSLDVPVLVSYGTKDVATPFNDYLHLETISANKSNFTFNAYIGWEHNYFGFHENGEVNYEEFNWTKVGKDWKEWLGEH